MNKILSKKNYLIQAMPQKCFKKKKNSPRNIKDTAVLREKSQGKKKSLFFYLYDCSERDTCGSRRNHHNTNCNSLKGVITPINKNLASTSKIYFFNQSNAIRQNLSPEIAGKCLGTGKSDFLPNINVYSEEKIPYCLSLVQRPIVELKDLV